MKHLFALIQRVLNSEQLVDADTVPANVGTWDSINHLHLITALEERYDVVFDPDEITTSTEGVNKIIQLINEKGVVLPGD